MKFLGKTSDWLRKHKVLGFSIGLILLGVVAVILYTTFRTTSDRAIDSGQAELKTQTEEVEKVVAKESKDLDFEVPMVEDVAEAIVKQEELDGELALVDKYYFIQDEYSEEVLTLALEGTLPSRKLTVNQNKQQLNQIKKNSVEGQSKNEGSWTIDTSKFLFEDAAIVASPNLINLTEGYTLENQSQFFNIGDYSVGGFHISPSKLGSEYGLEGYTTPYTFSELASAYKTFDVTSEYLTSASKDETATILTYFVRANKEISATDFLKDMVSLEFSVNGSSTLKFTEDETDYLSSDELFGDLGTIAQEDITVQSPEVYVIRQYISGNALKDSNNKITIADSEYNLKPVGANDAIDLTNTYSE